MNIQTLTFQSMAPPSFLNQPWSEVCQYNQSLYSSSKFRAETITCNCSGWSFNVSISDPNTIIPLSIWNSNMDIIDWLPDSVTTLKAFVPHNLTFQAWNLVGLSSLQNLELFVTLPSYWPQPLLNLSSPLQESTNNTFLPPNIQQLAIYGPIQSIPPSAWVAIYLSSLSISGGNILDMTLPPLVGGSYAPTLASLQIDSVQLVDCPDLAVIARYASAIYISGNCINPPQVSGSMYILESLSLTIGGFAGPLNSSFFSNLPAISNLIFDFPEVVTLCTGNCTLNSCLGGTQVTFNIPQVQELPIAFLNCTTSAIQMIAPVTNLSYIGPLSASSVTILSSSGFNFGSVLPSWGDFCQHFQQISTLNFKSGSMNSLPILSSSCFYLSAITLQDISAFDMTTLPDVSQFPLANFSFVDSNLGFVSQNICSSNINQIYLQGNLITSLPACAYMSSLTNLGLDQNMLSDPAQIISFANASTILSMLTLSWNQLGAASVMPNFVLYYPQLTILNLSSNSIASDISVAPYPSLIAQLTSFDLSNNSFYGTIDFIPTIASTSSSLVKMNLAGNELNGSIPAALLCPSPTQSLIFSYVYLGSNLFTGWSGFNDTSLSCTGSPLVEFSASENYLSWFPDFNFSSITSMRILDISSNQMMEGQPLPILTMNQMNMNRGANLNFAGNGLLGSIDPNFVSTFSKLSLENNQLYGSIPPGIFGDAGAGYSYTFNLQNNHFSGDFPLPPTFNPTLSQFAAIYLYMANNLMNGTIPASYPGFFFQDIDISQNPLLQGKVPIFDRNFLGSSNQNRIAIYNFSGSSSLDFCSYPYQANFFGFGEHIIAIVDNTSACNCPQLYQFDSLYPIQCPTLVPTPSPNVAPSPTACVGNPPGPSFVCVDGIWTGDTSISAGSITIGGPTIIGGDLTLGSGGLTVTVPFQSSSGNGNNNGFGPGGNAPLLTVTGCLNTPSLSLTLSQNDIDTIDKNNGHHVSVFLISQNSNCSNSISTLPMKLSQAKSCKKATVKSLSSSGNADQLIVDFQIDSSSCNVWWIVLCAILGSLALIIIVGCIIWLAWRRNMMTKAKARL